MTIDTKIKELYYTVQNKKKEIEAISVKPSWVTNCAFRYEADFNYPATTTINIQTVNDIDVLVNIAGWLTLQEERHTKGLEKLNLPSKPYTWLGYTVEEWVADISTRISRLSLADKKKELAILESKLKAILPPEFERELAMEDILNSDLLK